MTRLTVLILIAYLSLTGCVKETIETSGIVEPNTGQKETSEPQVWLDFKAKYNGDELAVTWDEHTGMPKKIVGLNAYPRTLQEGAVALTEQNVEAVAKEFVADNKELLNVDVASLKLIKARKIRNKWFVTFQQYYQNVPVYKSQVGLTFTVEGRVTSYGSNFHPSIEISTKPEIDEKQAETIARKSLEEEIAERLDQKEASLIVFPEEVEDGIVYHLAWEFLMSGERRDATIDTHFVIDANTGEVLLQYKMFPGQNVSGTVQGEIYPAVPTGPVSTEPVANEYVEISSLALSATTDASGNYTIPVGSSGSYTVTTELEGPFARVQNHDLSDFTQTQTCSTSSPCNFAWTPANAGGDRDSINVFYHLNLLHEFYKNVLSFSWVNAWTTTNQMRATVNHNFNNAYAGDPMQFGTDNYARSSDVVYHEATHNVLYDIFNGWIGWPSAFSEGYACDEGFADYFACAFTNDSSMGEGCGIGRNLDNTIQYPGTTYNYEGHYGGQIIAGAAWDLRSDFGLVTSDVDNLIFEALNTMSTDPSPYLFSNPSQSNLLESLMVSDDDDSNLTNGTPHDREIKQAFRNHDLLPVDVLCRDSPTDDGNVPTVGPAWISPDIRVDAPPYGATVHENPIYNQLNRVYISVSNLGYLTASGITINLYWSNPAGGIPWPSDWNLIGTQTIASLAAGASVEAGYIQWTPTGTQIGHRCLLVRLECNQDRISEDGNVRQDNNIAMKNVNIVPVSASPGTATADFVINRIEGENRNLRLTFIGAPGNLNVRFLIPDTVEFERVEGRVEVKKIKIRRGGCLGLLPWVKPVVKKEIRVISPIEPVTLTNFSVRKMERVVLEFALPEGIVPGNEFIIRVSEELEGQVIGGIDHIVRVE